MIRDLVRSCRLGFHSSFFVVAYTTLNVVELDSQVSTGTLRRVLNGRLFWGLLHYPLE